MPLPGRPAVFFGALVLVAGCSPALQHADDIAVRGQTPHDRLQPTKLEVAEAQLDEGDDSDAAGLAAPSRAMETVTIMRGRLVEVITVPIVEEGPAAADRTRAAVDCPNGKQGQGAAAAEAAKCPGGLLDGLETLRAGHLTMAVDPPPAGPATAADPDTATHAGATASIKAVPGSGPPAGTEAPADAKPAPSGPAARAHAGLSGAETLSEAVADDVAALPGPSAQSPSGAEALHVAAKSAGPAAARVAEEGVVAGTYIVFFDSDTAELSPDAREILAEVVRAAKGSAFSAIRASGHSDPTGSEAHNEWLSQRRTRAVVDFLVASGLDKQRIVTESYGSTDPLVPAAGAAAQMQNRRVEVQFLR